MRQRRDRLIFIFSPSIDRSQGPPQPVHPQPSTGHLWLLWLSWKTRVLDKLQTSFHSRWDWNLWKAGISFQTHLTSQLGAATIQFASIGKPDEGGILSSPKAKSDHWPGAYRCQISRAKLYHIYQRMADGTFALFVDVEHKSLSHMIPTNFPSQLPQEQF